MSVWNPDRYERFAVERALPFKDLMALVEPRPGMRVVDLGCGTAKLTRVLHDRLGAARTVAVDSSETMLAQAASVAGKGLEPVRADIVDWVRAAPRASLDLAFSNAALHWLDDQAGILSAITGLLAPGGQLAVQVPANFDHPSHEAARRVAAEAPFRDALDGYARGTPVLAPEAYATLLHRLGYVRQRVRLEVYGHVLDARDDVVEWVRGTLLTDYEQRLPADLWPRFVDRYRATLATLLPDDKPFFYPFKRILLHAVRAD